MAALRFGARASHESYDQYRLSLLLSSDLGHGITATFRPSLSSWSYDQTAPFFFEPRKDWEVSAFTQITLNDYSLYGYSPFVSYEFAYHSSNIELHDYSDHISKIGFTKIY